MIEPLGEVNPTNSEMLGASGGRIFFESAAVIGAKEIG